MEIRLLPSNAGIVASMVVETARQTGVAYVWNLEVLREVVKICQGESLIFVRECKGHRVEFTLQEMAIAIRDGIEIRPR